MREKCYFHSFFFNNSAYDSVSYSGVCNVLLPEWQTAKCCNKRVLFIKSVSHTVTHVAAFKIKIKCNSNFVVQITS